MPNAQTAKTILMDKASQGIRINFQGKTLFAGFRLNDNWRDRSKILSERLDKFCIPGAQFSLLSPKEPEIDSGWEPSGEIIVE